MCGRALAADFGGMFESRGNGTSGLAPAGRRRTGAGAKASIRTGRSPATPQDTTGEAVCARPLTERHAPARGGRSGAPARAVAPGRGGSVRGAVSPVQGEGTAQCGRISSRVYLAAPGGPHIPCVSGRDLQGTTSAGPMADACGRPAEVGWREGEEAMGREALPGGDPTRSARWVRHTGAGRHRVHAGPA